VSTHLIVGLYASQARQRRAVELSRGYDLADDGGGWEKGPRGGMRRKTASGQWEYQKKGGGAARQPRQAKQPAAKKPRAAKAPAAAKPRAAKKPPVQQPAQPERNEFVEREASRKKALQAKRKFPPAEPALAASFLLKRAHEGGVWGSNEAGVDHVARGLQDAVALGGDDAWHVGNLAEHFLGKRITADDRDALRDLAAKLLKRVAAAADEAQNAAMTYEYRHARGPERESAMRKAAEMRKDWLWRVADLGPDKGVTVARRGVIQDALQRVVRLM
jgi:hypothetical protein